MSQIEVLFYWCCFIKSNVANKFCILVANTCERLGKD